MVFKSQYNRIFRSIKGVDLNSLQAIDEFNWTSQRPTVITKTRSLKENKAKKYYSKMHKSCKRANAFFLATYCVLLSCVIIMFMPELLMKW